MAAENLPQMPRRVVFSMLAGLLAATPALAGDIHKQKAQVDAKISTLQGRIAAAQQRESSLRGQIESVLPPLTVPLGAVAIAKE